MIYVDRNIKEIEKEEVLREDLRNHSGVLDKDIIRYLDGLIDLDFTVVREDISSNDRKILSQLDLYKKIATYNIYKRSREVMTNLFDSHKLLYNIKGNEDKIEGLCAYIRLSTGNFEVFNFNYSKGINNITLSRYNAYTNAEKEEELCRIFKELEYLYDEKNPYPDSLSDNHFGGPHSSWNFEHSKKIQMWQDKFTELDERKITEEDRKNVEITKKVYEYLFDDFGLKDEDFKEEKDSQRGNVYVKTMPLIKIRKNIKYI